jgi:hypothetical protein
MSPDNVLGLNAAVNSISYSDGEYNHLADHFIIADIRRLYDLCKYCYCFELVFVIVRPKKSDFYIQCFVNFF